MSGIENSRTTTSVSAEHPNVVEEAENASSATAAALPNHSSVSSLSDAATDSSYIWVVENCLRQEAVLNPQNLLQVPPSTASLHAGDNAFVRHDSTSIIRASADEVVKQKIVCCLCTLNTKLAVYFAASFGLCLHASGVFFYCIRGQFGYSIPSLLSALLYLSVLFAQNRQKSSLFLPFLTGNAIFLIIWTCLAIYLAIVLIWLPDWCVTAVEDYFEWDEVDQLIGGDPNGERLQIKARLFIGASLAFTIVYILIECWLWWTILRGYRAFSNRRSVEWLSNLNKHIRSVSIY